MRTCRSDAKGAARSRDEGSVTGLDPKGLRCSAEATANRRREEPPHAVAFDRGALPVVLAHRALADDAQRHIAFGPGHKPTAGRVQALPPGIIGIGFVKDVSGAGLDRLPASGAFHTVSTSRRLDSPPSCPKVSVTK